MTWMLKQGHLVPVMGPGWSSPALRMAPCPGEVPVQSGQAGVMSSICHCPVTAVPCQPWAHLSHFQQPWGSGEHLENGFSWKIKIINRKLKKGKREKLTSKTSSSKCKTCPSSCSALVVFLESVACTLRNKKTTG